MPQMEDSAWLCVGNIYDIQGFSSWRLAEKKEEKQSKRDRAERDRERKNLEWNKRQSKQRKAVRAQAKKRLLQDFRNAKKNH